MKNKFRAFYISALAVVGIGLFGTAIEPLSHSAMGNPSIPVPLFLPQTGSLLHKLKMSTPGRRAAAVPCNTPKSVSNVKFPPSCLSRQ